MGTGALQPGPRLGAAGQPGPRCGGGRAAGAQVRGSWAPWGRWLLALLEASRRPGCHFPAKLVSLDSRPGTLSQRPDIYFSGGGRLRGSRGGGWPGPCLLLAESRVSGCSPGPRGFKPPPLLSCESISSLHNGEWALCRRGKRGDAPSHGEHLPHPRHPQSTLPLPTWGWGETLFLGCFLPHFSFLCDCYRPSHTLKQASCPDIPFPRQRVRGDWGWGKGTPTLRKEPMRADLEAENCFQEFRGV